MFRIVKGALLSAAVIMAQNMFCIQIIGVCQPCQKIDQRIVGLLCEGAILCLIAALYGNRIVISGLYRVRNFIQRDTLNDLAFIAYDKMIF